MNDVMSHSEAVDELRDVLLEVRAVAGRADRNALVVHVELLVDGRVGRVARCASIWPVDYEASKDLGLGVSVVEELLVEIVEILQHNCKNSGYLRRKWKGEKNE